MASSFVIGVAGGSGSGKTTVVRRIVDSLGPEQVTLLDHDRYYRDRNDLRLEERAALNYDHPDALETDLMVQHVRALRAGQAVDVPQYDFTRHARLSETETFQPRRALIVEGILVFTDAGAAGADGHQGVRRHRFGHALHPPPTARRRATRPHDGVGDRSVPAHREADAPRVRRAEQALCGRDHPAWRAQHGRRRAAVDDVAKRGSRRDRSPAATPRCGCG